MPTQPESLTSQFDRWQLQKQDSAGSRKQRCSVLENCFAVLFGPTERRYDPGGGEPTDLNKELSILF